ncbi:MULTISPECIES: DUF1772 domain-containing protein [Actinomadura]|uniref:DUF1772 domain-containing protein n=1 Tax=Actinomadura litoris TaxID=2678616 RepID=A0A7K1KZ11_9ACTN|nr:MULTISPECIES: anthrone oxygenase family protein [Actinomadura]MBT2212303.1 DUF1772 domain-containing protein [Actinomadura sp. NEAU-AAG7]MUN37205.1 DUF1772 domain-containing protein [Actinomadura litoris]
MKFSLTAASAALSILMASGMAGAFFVFSCGVMPGLNAARPSSAINAMQTINQKIQNPLFVGAFMLLPVLAVVAGVLLMSLGQKSAAILFFAAAAVYVVGALVPSFAVNIPMNNDLDAVRIPSGTREAAEIWSDYSGRWTAWNTVRAVFSWASLLLMGAGAYVWGKGA